MPTVRANSAVLALVVGATLLAPMATGQVSSDDPVAVATAFFDKSVRLWNEQGRTDSTPSMYTDDADLINSLGPHWHGRAEIARNTGAVVSTFRPALSYRLISAKAVAPGVILAIGVGIADIPAGQPGAGRHELRQSLLLVKQGDDWKIRFWQSTPMVSSDPVNDRLSH
jgi:uncharacterized protein (TIGR02246 family)